MDLQTWITLAGFLFVLLSSIIGMAITWAKQSSNIDAVKVDASAKIEAAREAAKNEVRLVKLELDNHKQSHTELVQRVEKHEGKIDEKLESISGKVDDLKTLIIEKLGK